MSLLTSSGHTVTMDRVTVAELKAKLSHYLREVRGGKSFTVTSRDIPVATLGPYEPEELEALEIIAADVDAPPLWQPVMGPSRVTTDAAQLIREDRDAADEQLDRIMHESGGRSDRGQKGPPS